MVTSRSLNNRFSKTRASITILDRRTIYKRLHPRPLVEWKRCIPRSRWGWTRLWWCSGARIWRCVERDWRWRCRERKGARNREAWTRRRRWWRSRRQRRAARPRRGWPTRRTKIGEGNEATNSASKTCLSQHWRTYPRISRMSVASKPAIISITTHFHITSEPIQARPIVATFNSRNEFWNPILHMSLKLFRPVSNCHNKEDVILKFQKITVEMMQKL